MDLSQTQSKFLMLVAMRYYYTYHYQRRFSAAEIVIYAYNKLTDDLRKALVD
jgi:protein tyrosine/serine phosphatase